MTETTPSPTESAPVAESPVAEVPAAQAEVTGDTSLLGETPTTETPVEAVERVSADTVFTLPEGMSVNDEVMGKFKELATTAGLQPKVAQELLDLYSSDVRAIADQLADSQSESYRTMRTEWRSQIESDPIFSGEKKAAALTTLGQAFDVYGSKEAREAFNLTGAGDNPAIVKMIYNMAQALSEGRPVPAGGPSASKPKGAAAFYPNGGATERNT